MVMKYPTTAEVVKADREHIFRWWEMLPRPQNEREKRVYELIVKKFRCLGGVWTRGGNSILGNGQTKGPR